MARYLAKAQTWLSHECRMVNEGEEFETVFPTVKVDGKQVPMRLGENLELIEKKSHGKDSAE